MMYARKRVHKVRTGRRNSAGSV